MYYKYHNIYSTESLKRNKKNMQCYLSMYQLTTYLLTVEKHSDTNILCVVRTGDRTM